MCVAGGRALARVCRPREEWWRVRPQRNPPGAGKPALVFHPFQVSVPLRALVANFRDSFEAL